MRRLAVSLVVLASVLPSFGDEPSPEAAAKEALRRRLVAAMDAQRRVHHAMAWETRKPGEEARTLLTEIYREGDRAGLRAHGTMLEGHEMLGVTDGRVFVLRLDGVDVSGDLPGTRVLNERFGPFRRARAAIGSRWGASLEAPLRRTTFDLHLDDRGGFRVTFKVQMKETSCPAEWLEPGYLGGKALTADEPDGTARIAGGTFEGRIRLRDGLPIRWTGRSPTTGGGVSASAAPPEWTAERWTGAIEDLCSGREPNLWFLSEVGGREIPLMDLELGGLLRAAASACPTLAGDAEKLRTLAAEAVAADLECEEMTAVPPGLSLEAWNGKVSERIRGIHQAVGLGLAKWDPWKREPLANLMVDALRGTADRLWRERADRTE